MAARHSPPPRQAQAWHTEPCPAGRGAGLPVSPSPRGTRSKKHPVQRTRQARPSGGREAARPAGTPTLGTPRLDGGRAPDSTGEGDRTSRTQRGSRRAGAGDGERGRPLTAVQSGPRRFALTLCTRGHRLFGGHTPDEHQPHTPERFPHQEQIRVPEDPGPTCIRAAVKGRRTGRSTLTSQLPPPGRGTCVPPCPAGTDGPGPGRRLGVGQPAPGDEKHGPWWASGRFGHTHPGLHLRTGAVCLGATTEAPGLSEGRSPRLLTRDQTWEQLPAAPEMHLIDSPLRRQSHGTRSRAGVATAGLSRVRALS